ncbi:MAG: DUF3180 domain-containing protein [Mycobacteriales bacterium]
MKPTRWTTVVALALGAGLLGWLVADRAYGDLVTLPVYAPVTALIIALFELGLAKVVADKVRGRSPGRPMHPLQVARAAVLAKASSTAGALLLGLYGGLFAWTFPRRDKLAAASHDALVAGLSAGACLLLLVAALLLERSCRTPPEHE